LAVTDRLEGHVGRTLVTGLRERQSQSGVFVAIALFALAVVAVVTRPTDDRCPSGTVYHLPAGTCIAPSSLILEGDVSDVEAAIAPYQGSILFTTFGMHHVRFPVESLAALDRVKDKLVEAGFEVRYSLVLLVDSGP
jgi:hypothetical protein